MDKQPEHEKDFTLGGEALDELALYNGISVANLKTDDEKRKVLIEHYRDWRSE